MRSVGVGGMGRGREIREIDNLDTGKDRHAVNTAKDSGKY